MTAPHLDDTQLSSLLDEGLHDDHLSSCRACDARLRALRSARDALASAAVTPLPAATVDEMVAHAIAALDEPVTTPAASRGPRRPPSSWLLAAAAAIAVLTGVAGLVRVVSPNVSSNDSATSAADGESDRLATDLQAKAESVGGASFDPEIVGADLGDQSDPAALAAVLNQTNPTVAAPAAAAARGAGQETDEASPAMPPAPTTTVVDRARCRSAAERVGAGQLGMLQSTSLVRWKGSLAEVLVFTLAEPAGGFTRQALVLRRPDCVLLADPRF